MKRYGLRIIIALIVALLIGIMPAARGAIYFNYVSYALGCVIVGILSYMFVKLER